MWIIPEKDSVNVYIGIGFEGNIDSALARLILNVNIIFKIKEMEESKR